jgi:uncharacterized protein (TIGR02285 family)
MKHIAYIQQLLLLGMLFANSALATERIPLYFNDRPPYLVPAPDGSASGLTGTPSAQAFNNAGIAFVWAKMPTNRQLMSIKMNSAMGCAVGWFKTPEREQYAKFTKAIYRDKPAVGLANNGFTVTPNAALKTVMATKGVRILAKDKFSYGSFIDDLIGKLKPHVTYTTTESSLMVEMIRVGRADFMFVAEEEAAFLAEGAGANIREFHLIRFADMPEGEKRYIMCSKQTPDALINRLNKAITFE